MSDVIYFHEREMCIFEWLSLIFCIIIIFFISLLLPASDCYQEFYSTTVKYSLTWYNYHIKGEPL